MKAIFTTLLVAFGLVLAQAQCPTGNVTLYSQAQVDAFGVNWPNCENLGVNLEISGNSITDLSALSNLVSIEGSLNIEFNTSLTSLAGLENLNSLQSLNIYGNTDLTNLIGLGSLSSVDWSIWIYNNDVLVSLVGLENLSSVGESFKIEANDVLASLTGLGNLGSVGYSLTITDNQALNSLTSLQNLSSVGDLVIHNNTALTSLIGLGNLSSIGEGVQISNNSGLTSLAGLEGISSLNASFVINNNDGLTSLAGLENLNWLQQYLEIYLNDGLTSLEGLESLISVGEGLFINGNSNLSVCNALAVCQYLQSYDPTWQSIEIINNASGCDSEEEVILACAEVSGQCPTGNVILSTQAEVDAFGVNWPNCTDFPDTLTISGADITNLSGLSGLTSIGNNLIIEYNDALANFTGLENLTSVGGDLYIYGNADLVNFTGLENLSSIGQGLFIGGNSALVNLTGLENLTSVGDLWFTENVNLVNLAGLENINSVGNLWFYLNYSLTSLTGLENLSYIGESLTLYDNPNLSACSIWAVCQYVQTYENVGIVGNDSGCNSESEILSSCTGIFSHVSGQVYADIDCNGTFDGADGYALNFLISESDGTPITTTNSGGEYIILLAPNSTNAISVNAPAGLTVYPDTFQIVTDTTLTAYTGYDFRLCFDSIFSDASVIVAALDPPQPGFNNTYHICYQNIGSLPTDATLTLTFSGEAAAYLSISDANGGIVSGNTVTWSLTDVPVFGQGCFMVVVSLLPETPLGSLLTANASISVVSDVIADSYENTQTVVGSYDPNDKTVSPTEIDFATAEGPQRLTYTVRFQNTGTFAATFVEVLDTLEANLDITTLQLLSASHAYTLTVLDDHILKFRFDDINLPDSTTDEVGSHGYIMFSLETVAGLQLGDVVSNSAAIYFDFNAPVITNTAATEFVTPTLTPTAKMPLQVLPNPTRNTATVFFEGSSRTKIQLLNTLGSVIQQHEVSGSSVTLDVSALPSGVYFVRATSGAAMGTAKLVKE